MWCSAVYTTFISKSDVFQRHNIYVCFWGLFPRPQWGLTLRLCWRTSVHKLPASAPLKPKSCIHPWSNSEGETTKQLCTKKISNMWPTYSKIFRWYSQNVKHNGIIAFALCLTHSQLILNAMCTHTQFKINPTGMVIVQFNVPLDTL